MNAITLRNAQQISIDLLPAAVAQRDTAVAASQAIKSVSDETSQLQALAAVRELKAIAKEVESGRAEAKGPVLDIGRKIDGIAKEFVGPVDAEIRRLNCCLTAYQAEQARLAAEAERKRQEEIRRAEEAKRKAEDEARRLAIEAERARQAERAAAEAELLADDRSNVERAAAEAEAARIERERAQKAEADLRAAAAKAEAERMSAAAQVVRGPAKVAGLAVRKVPRFEVINLREFVEADIKRPAVTRLCTYEPSVAAINNAIRNGLTEFPGLRIWNEEVATAR